MNNKIWTTEKEVKWAEEGLLKLKEQLITGNYDQEYDLESEIKRSEEIISNSKKYLTELKRLEDEFDVLNFQYSYPVHQAKALLDKYNK